VRLEGLGKLKKYSNIIGIRTRELAARSIKPQRTTLPRAPHKSEVSTKLGVKKTFGK
jgi:hypothetical protein